MVLTTVLVLIVMATCVQGKWVEGRVDTKENWAFLARFCFLSLEGQFEYLIEFERDIGTPNLLLYYDDDSQWPAVYHSSKTCKEREAVLNKGQNQMIKLSHWYPDTEYSGCVLSQANKKLPAVKSTTAAPRTLKPNVTTKPKNVSNITKLDLPSDPTYYHQFLKTTTPKPITTISDTNSTTWYELSPTDYWNSSTTVLPDDELWENIGPEKNYSKLEKLKDVELLFQNYNGSGHKIKRSTFELLERYHRRRLNSASKQSGESPNSEKVRFVVTCHNSRRFRSARERWWFIAISNCDSPKGLDVRYKFLMTNGPNGDFWHEHFSADEFYVLPILLAYTFAYVIVMVAVVMCSVELKSRHLLHSTYKLFLMSLVAQHMGVMLQSLAGIRYASNGVGNPSMRVTGQFFCGISEMTFLLLLILMAKGYTITRGRLKVGFTVKLTIFMCCYVLTYVGLFVYQAKAFDPGEVLYLYESPAGYGIIILRITAWCAFAYSTFFTVKKYPEKNMFYCPFFICGTLWFYAGPLFILTANSYIDKWVRESVVTAVLLFITFSGHVMFLLLTLPVFANKNFPYHVRTTQIGVMEVTGGSSLDRFGPTAYHPNERASQTVIIPLTRRTEELIGNMYNQYMATSPLSLENETPKLNGLPKRIDSVKSKASLIPQISTETNTSEDINPSIKEEKDIFTVDPKIAPKTRENDMSMSNGLPDDEKLPNTDNIENGVNLPEVLRSRRNILEPLNRDVPIWSLAKGPCVVAMQLKKSMTIEGDVLPILLAYTFAYVIVLVAVVMCSVELKSRHLLHSTYKLFLMSLVAQHMGVMLQSLAGIRYASNGVGNPSMRVTGQFFCGISEMTFLLLLILMAKGYTITRGRLKVGFTVKLTIFMCCYVLTYVGLFVYQARAFDPGEVLYLYESPAGYGIIILRITAWCAFAYSTFFTVKKYPEKNMFYCPFFICGTLWFYAGPLFILTANSYIDKWVRESVVTAVLLFITFSGHVMFLLLTLPVFANKNFPYHVRTTQIGVMEVTGGSSLDRFGPTAYHPNERASQTVIIPLTRRTEELIGNMYNQYMATSPLSLENETPKLNGLPKRIDSVKSKAILIPQISTETNTSEDINPSIKEEKDIFTVDPKIAPKTRENDMLMSNGLPDDEKLPNTDNIENGVNLPEVLRSRRNILEPLNRDVPIWSLAKGPCVVAMQLKKSMTIEGDTAEIQTNGRKPSLRTLQSGSGEMSTIHEGREKSYVRAPVDIFTVPTRG